MQRLLSVLAILKQSIVSKKRYCQVRNTPGVLNLLLCLYRLGYCSAVKRNGNQLTISLTYVNGMSSLRQLKMITKLSHKKCISLKKSFRLQSIYLLSTSKGVISHLEAISYGVGGVALAICN